MIAVVSQGTRRTAPIPATGGGGGGSFPVNLPNGYTTQLDTSFNLLGSGDHGVPVWSSTNTSGLRLRDSGDQPRITLIDASTGLHTHDDGTTFSTSSLVTTGMSSPTSAFSGVFPQGGTLGSAPWNLNPDVLTGFPKLYVGMVVMLSSNFSAAATTGIKHLWPEIDPAGGIEKTGTDIYTGWDDSNGNSAGVRLDYQIFQQGAVARGMGANQGAGSITAANFANFLGVWKQLELLLEVNTDNATANGRVRVWVDGALTHDYTDVNWQGTASPRKWNHLELGPTWGGATGQGTQPPADMYIYKDRLIIAGSN